MPRSVRISIIAALVAFTSALPVRPEGELTASAMEQTQLQPVHDFLLTGGDPNVVTNHGTLLEVAIKWNRIDLVKALLSQGAEPNRCGPDGQCAVIVATRSDTEILRLLLQAGADSNRTTSKFNYSPLGLAAGTQLETFARLREAGRYHGPAPNVTESVRLLLRAGANPNHVDSFGDSPLRTAIRINSLDVARALIEAGADVQQRLDDKTSKGQQRGNSILMSAIWRYPQFRDEAAIELLLDHGANPNDRNDLPYDSECDETTSGKCSWRGYTVLAYAAKNGMAPIVLLLLQYGADPRIPRSDGKLPLTLALENHHQETAKLIQEGLNR